MPNDMNLPPYPGNGYFTGVEAQEAEGRIAQAIVNCPGWKLLSGRQQAYLFGVASMLALPNVTSRVEVITTYVSEALHFRRGIRE